MDTNDLNLKPILNLSSNLVQVVTKSTRINTKTGYGSILDPVIMTLSSYYQEPIHLQPLDPDPDSNGSPSDHMIIIVRPINTVNNKPVRTYRTVSHRPVTESSLKLKFI